jgi:NADH-quinone oxidoreductase subunit C
MTTEPAGNGRPPGDLAEVLARRFAGGGEAAQVEDSYGQVTVEVSPSEWVAAVTAARDELGFTYFDWLTAVDQLDDAETPGFDVVAHLWSVPRREHLLMRTRVPADDPRLASVTGVFAGASWHERETYEMFGVTFDGHPHLVPLLLPDGFEGHPLRKDFVLAARVAKAWPGAKEPGESDADHSAAPSRRKTRPPGVPDPEVWGPKPPGSSS